MKRSYLGVAATVLLFFWRNTGFTGTGFAENNNYGGAIPENITGCERWGYGRSGSSYFAGCQLEFL